jgi:DNA-binding response OmpR family regulator
VILRLRRKLPRPDALETVRGVGFRLSPEAR